MDFYLKNIKKGTYVKIFTMKYIKRAPYMILLLITSLIILSVTGCTIKKSTEPISRTAFKLNTIITITIYDSDNEALLDDCIALCDKYEKIFSRTNQNSELYKLNDSVKNGILSTKISQEMNELLTKGLYFSSLSNGAMDITIEPLISLWDFNSSKPFIPDSKLLKNAVSLVNYKNVTLTKNAVSFSKTNMGIDLGAIAKGYIGDEIKEYLVTAGVKSAMINLGGNVLCIGHKLDNTPFKVGIQKPFAEKNETIQILNIDDMSVVSSGVYERYFKKDDQLYHHILNPQTGYPYDNDLFSVTIISQQSVDGDGLSTACFSMGLEKGLKLIESLDNTYAVFITADNKLHYSDGFEDFIYE